MTQCVAKTKEGKPCQVPAGEGQRYCHIHRGKRFRRLITGIVAVITVSATIIGMTTDLVGLFNINLPISYPTNIPTSTSTILPSTQTQVTNLAPAPTGTLHRIRFVVRSIPADGEVHNAYYSVDDGAEQLLFPAGEEIDHTFYTRFFRSICVRVDIKSETLLYEELHVDGELKASGNTGNEGLIYQISP